MNPAADPDAQMLVYRAKQILYRNLRQVVRRAKRLPSESKTATARAIYLVTGSFFVPEVLYPPSVTVPRTADWYEKHGKNIGATFYPLDDACIYRNTMPKTVHGEVRRQLAMDLDYLQVETFTLVLPGEPGSHVWDDGHIIAPGNVILSDVSADFEHINGVHSSGHRWKLQNIRKLNGTMAVLATDGAKLYYHWIFQLLPRFELIRQCGIATENIDYFLVNKLQANFQRESLRLLGIKDSQIIETDGRTLFSADKIVVPSIPLGAGNFPPWMTEFLRNLFIPPEVHNLKQRTRRIYITRRKAAYRRVLNEAKVLEFITPLGFEVIEFESLTIREQARIMAEADVVLAPHGGGLTNFIFCAPGTRVIEIFSPELVAGYFWKLCSRLKLDYYYLLGTAAPETRARDYPQSWDARADITVDIGELSQTLTLASVK